MNHWRVGVGEPVTTAVKVTGAPAVMDWAEGWVVKVGRVLTVRVAESEATPEGAAELVATSL